MAQKSVKLPFLQPVGESEALSMGVNLSEKNSHVIYRHIKSLTTVKAAREGGLYSLQSPLPEGIQIGKIDTTNIVARLVRYQLLSQLFWIAQHEEENQLVLRPCFVAHPGDELGQEQLEKLYVELVMLSVAAIEKFIDSRPPFTHVRLNEDLALDLGSEKSLDPASLKFATFTIHNLITAKKFPVVPHAELISRTLNYILGELKKRNRLLELPYYGLMPIRNGELRQQFETTADFMVRKVAEHYRTLPDLRGELNNIRKDEAEYLIDEFAPPTADYALRRARAIESAIGPAEGSWYPGKLTLEMVLQLESPMRSRYSEEHKEELTTRYRELTAALFSEDVDWRLRLLLISEKERWSLHPEVWRLLQQESGLWKSRWETTSGTIYIFTARNPLVLRLLVNKMPELPDDQSWQILALRSLITTYENQLRDLLEDPHFAAAYDKLLARVYLPYMPLIYRVVQMIGLGLMKSRSFLAATQNIMREQHKLIVRNKRRREELKKRRDAELDQRREELAGLLLADRIRDMLDQFIVSERYLPTVYDLQVALPDISPEQLDAALESGRFQRIEVDSSRGAEAEVVLFALNYEWRQKALLIGQVVDAAFEKGSKSGEIDGFAEKRARVVRRHVERTLRGAAMQQSDSGGGSADPYREFEKLVKRHRK